MYIQQTRNRSSGVSIISGLKTPGIDRPALTIYQVRQIRDPKAKKIHKQYLLQWIRARDKKTKTGSIPAVEPKPYLDYTTLPPSGTTRSSVTERSTGQKPRPFDLISIDCHACNNPPPARQSWQPKQVELQHNGGAQIKQSRYVVGPRFSQKSKLYIGKKKRKKVLYESRVIEIPWSMLLIFLTKMSLALLFLRARTLLVLFGCSQSKQFASPWS